MRIQFGFMCQLQQNETLALLNIPISYYKQTNEIIEIWIQKLVRNQHPLC